MDISEKKEKLSAALRLRKRINRLADSLSDYMQTGGVRAIAYSFEPPGGDRRLSLPEIPADLQSQIQELEEDFKFEAEIARRIIQRANLNERHEKLLIYRFCDCLPWKEIEPRIGWKRCWAAKQLNLTVEKISM
jgi:hypothetical protein